MRWVVDVRLSAARLAHSERARRLREVAHQAVVEGHVGAGKSDREGSLLVMTYAAVDLDRLDVLVGDGGDTEVALVASVQGVLRHGLLEAVAADGVDFVEIVPSGGQG